MQWLACGAGGPPGSQTKPPGRPYTSSACVCTPCNDGIPATALTASCSPPAERKGAERFWVFGVSARQLQCIVVSGGEEPAVPPPPQRPLVSSVPLRAAVVGQAVALAPLEADIIR